MKWICSKQIQKITYFTDNICNKEIKQVFTFHCNKNEMMKKHQEKMHKIRRPLIFSDAILRLFFPLYDLKLYLTVITELAIFFISFKVNFSSCHDSIYLGLMVKTNWNPPLFSYKNEVTTSLEIVLRSKQKYLILIS